MRSALVCRQLLVSIVLFMAQVSFAQHGKGSYHGRKAVEGEALVKFRQITSASAAEMVQSHDLTSIRPLGGVRNLYRLRSRSKKVDQLVTELAARPDVMYAEPNYEWYALEIPNDPQFTYQWALQNLGQSTPSFAGGMPGADISAISAWDISTGSKAHVVGIVDTGIDYTHPDLQTNIWSAPSDFSVTLNGVPITCPAGTHGFNAIDGTCYPMDDHMHGTHVSGIIGAAGDNSVGIAGVNWTTQLMGLKFLSASGSGYTSDAVTAIEFGIQAKAYFASQNGADLRVLSNSWGGGGFSQALQDEVDRAASNNILFVAAAGNSSVNIDVMPMYPAAFNRANMINVAATDNNDGLAGFSNYGPKSVHLGAPGVAVLSTLPNNTYGYLSGTSMATPQVSGAAALMLSVCSLDTAGVKEIILDNVDAIASLSTQTITGGRLNVNHAIRSCNGPVGLSPMWVSFGTGLVGKNSKPSAVILTNYQDVPLRIDNISIAGDFIQSNDCGTSVGARASCTITVNFNPSIPGGRNGQLQVIDDASNSPQVAQLSGTGAVSADLVATASIPATVISPGAVVTVSSTVTNQGTADAGSSVAGIYLSKTATKSGSILSAATVSVPMLQAGQSFSTQAALSIPSTVNPGAYYVIACADDTNVITESDETNNCSAAPSALQVQLADLVESSVSFVQSDGQTIQITDTAANQGLADAIAFVTQYYASPYTWKNTSARQLTGSRSISGLSAGASSQGTATVGVPDDLVGTYYVVACADDTGVVRESSESNNCAASASKVQVGPDLVEYGISSAQSSSGPGLSIAVSDTTSNSGNHIAANSVTQFYLAPYSSKSTAAHLLGGNRSVGTLNPGGSSAGTTNVTVPADMAVGSYYLLACADDNGQVAESNENNNCASSATKIQIGPDLAESGVSSSQTITGPGLSLTVTDTASNQGGGSAAAFITQYYLSPYTTKSTMARLLIGSRSIPGLAPSAAMAGTTNITVPSDMAIGSYYLLACADDTSQVAETNENNNCAAATAKIQVGPDLIESAVNSAQSLTGSGQSITVSDTAMNQGGAAAGASITQYYLAPYTTKTSAARLLAGGRPIMMIGAGASSSGTVVVTIPVDMAVGSYYLLACADDAAQVPEISESNNCVASSSKIQVGPDLVETGVSSSPTLTGAGLNLTAADTTINQGGGSVGSSSVQYYLAPYTTKNTAARLLSGSRTISVLPPGGSSAGTSVVTVPSDMATGSYYLLACADDTGQVMETSENNNCGASPVKVQVGSDMVESGVSSSVSATGPGLTLIVNDTAIDQGGGSAASSITQYYLAPYASKTAAARLLAGNRMIAALTPGGTSSGITSVVVPADMALGSYYVLACADDTNVVQETNESNNCAAASGKIQVLAQ